jgi:hypothetical protein
MSQDKLNVMLAHVVLQQRTSWVLRSVRTVKVPPYFLEYAVAALLRSLQSSISTTKLSPTSISGKGYIRGRPLFGLSFGIGTFFSISKVIVFSSKRAGQ